MATDLDQLRSDILTWLDTLWVGDGSAGTFRLTPTHSPCLMSGTDTAWIAHCVGGLPELEDRRKPWIAWLQAKQNPESGEYLHDQPNCHKRGHAFWQTARAFNILGGQMLAFPEYLRSVLSIAGLRHWFAENSDCHQTLGLIPVLVSLDDPDYAAAFFEEIARKQDPETGLWPGGAGELGHSFAFTVLHNAAGKLPNQAGKILDYALAVLGDNLATGAPFGRDGNHPGFKTMDTVYLIGRLSAQLDCRRSESLDLLNQLADRFVASFFARWQDPASRPDTHSLLANLHTFGLLSESLPARFPSSRLWRFDWDQADLYFCRPIAEQSRARHKE